MFSNHSKLTGYIGVKKNADVMWWPNLRPNLKIVKESKWKLTLYILVAMLFVNPEISRFFWKTGESEADLSLG